MYFWTSFFDDKEEMIETLIIFSLILLTFSIFAIITYFTIGLNATIPSCTHPAGYPILIIEGIVSIIIGGYLGYIIIKKEK